MNLLLSFRSELIKTKRTSIRYLSLIAASMVPVYSYFDSSAAFRLADLKKDPWNLHFMGFGGSILNMMILPFFLLLICSLVAQLEFRNNTWKQVYVAPQPLLNVFVSKYLMVQLLLIGVILLSCFFMLVSLYAVHFFKAGLDLSRHHLDWGRFLDFWGRIYVTVLAISAFQFWLSLRFKNFIIPILIGIFLLFAGAIMLEEHPWVHDDKYPYLYPMRNYFPKNPSERTTVLWGSIAYTFLFLLLGFLDFRRSRSTP